jgi:hypothetical protein
VRISGELRVRVRGFLGAGACYSPPALEGGPAAARWTDRGGVAVGELLAERGTKVVRARVGAGKSPEMAAVARSRGGVSHPEISNFRM